MNGTYSSSPRPLPAPSKPSHLAHLFIAIVTVAVCAAVGFGLFFASQAQ